MDECRASLRMEPTWEGLQGCARKNLGRKSKGLFWWHVGHTLILVVSDAAKASQVAISSFGYFQKTPLLSRDLTRAILPKHVWVRVKTWAETRLESKIKRVEVKGYQDAEVREHSWR